MSIVHECIHALHDVYGGKRLSSERGSGFSTRADNEAAAYVGEALFSLYDTGAVYSDSIRDVSFAIATRIKGSAGAAVTAVVPADDPAAAREARRSRGPRASDKRLLAPGDLG